MPCLVVRRKMKCIKIRRQIIKEKENQNENKVEYYVIYFKEKYVRNKVKIIL